MPDRVSVTPSQSGGSAKAVPLGWTAHPLALCWSDTKLLFRNLNNVIGILVPFKARHPLDELYPTFMNMWTLGLHVFLVLYQLAFLVSLALALVFMIPYPLVLLWCAAVLGVNKLITRFLLNGSHAYLDSRASLLASSDDPHENERWIFLNGVAVGSHWLQANIDRLSLTFRRPIRGVHNATDGIIFDLIQCIIERNFAYSTQDVREAYVQIKEALLSPQYEKVVLLLHSEGGIQGSLIVDWLLSEAPQSLLSQLEIYTFGNAANHFNNPCKSIETYHAAMKGESTSGNKSLRYIEHYASSGDFVACWGLLAFTKIPVRYMGRIFERPGTGHLLNQHYLNALFPLDQNERVKETNKFMEMAVDSADRESSSPEVQEREHQAATYAVGGQDQRLLGRDHREGLMETLMSEIRPDHAVKDAQFVKDVNSPVERILSRESKTIRVKDFSRLWAYRDGRTPAA